MSAKEILQAKHEAESSIAALMLSLELARERGDFEAAAAAKKELGRRGVRISYGKPTREAAHAAR